MLTIQTIETITASKWNKYPCIGINNETLDLVLFKNYGIGTSILNRKNSKDIGMYKEDWNMPDFSPFYGVITILNSIDK